MSKKTPIHLTIDAELYELIMNYKAVHTDFSISQELEEWIKIKINHQDQESETFDYDKEKARLVMEMRKLESRKELSNRQEEQDKVKQATIDHIIDNQLEYSNAGEVAELRKDGLVFLWKSRYNETINPLQAKEMIETRLKERGLL